jgi:signal transduction histidine kinase
MRPRNWLFDALLAAWMVLWGLLGTGLAGLRQPGSARVDGVALALVAVAGAALAVRRRWPPVTLGVVALVVCVYRLRDLPYGPVFITFAIAVYTAAVLLPMRRAVPASAIALLLYLGHTVVGPLDFTGLLPESAWVVVPFAVGTTVRLTREAGRRSREERARELASDERLRIAQEVHDVVGHGLAAINMQAEIALHLLPSRPEQAEAALSAISRTSKGALDELRATLSVVRRGGDRAPAPGLGQLDALRDRLAGTGLPVEIEVTGERRELPAAIDLAAYRVVQESLTNVLRHAGVATATVRVDHRPDEVTVEVIDTGRGGVAPPARDASAGHGIPGMRERVTALGGTFTAGPVPGAGFRVYARLPVEER